MRNSVVHLILNRSANNPGMVRWYVRHVWWAGPGSGARDAVVVNGEFESPIGQRHIKDVVREALSRALVALGEADD